MGGTAYPMNSSFQAIRHALPRGIKFHVGHFNYTLLQRAIHDDHSPEQGHIHKLHTDVIPTLACPPIAELAKEALYTQNTF